MKEYWNQVYKNASTHMKFEDNWLSTFTDRVSYNNKKVFEIGCGIGKNISFLERLNCNVFVGDISLNILKSIDSTKLINFDLSSGLPLKSNSFDIIISELSIHYFTKEKTKFIVSELKRVVKNDGYVILRVNSINDSNFGANSSKLYEIEENFYDFGSIKKRFFTKDDIYEYFKDFEILSCEENVHRNYGADKILFDVVLTVSK